MGNSDPLRCRAVISMRLFQDRALAGRKKALQALCVGLTIAVRDE